MKKINILLLALSLLILKNIYANDKPNSSLNLSLYDGDNFTAVFNNINVKEPTDEINLNDLEAGKYYLKVMRESPGLDTIPVLIFSDYVDIPNNCKIYAVIDESGKFKVYKKINDLDKYYQNHKRICDCDCDSCRNYVYKNENLKSDEKIDEQKENEGNNPENNCNGYSMKDSDLQYAIKTINEKPFEETKIAIIKQIIDSNILTSLQVRELLKTFTFDDSKVEIAEYAYNKTCDKKNYFKIYDVFMYGSNVQLVKDYISNKKN